MCCFLIARKSADGAGSKHVADKCCASSFLVWSKRMTTFTTGDGPVGVDISNGICSGISFTCISHNPFSLRFPVMMTLLFLIILKNTLKITPISRHRITVQSRSVIPWLSHRKCMRVEHVYSIRLKGASLFVQSR